MTGPEIAGGLGAACAVLLLAARPRRRARTATRSGHARRATSPLLRSVRRIAGVIAWPSTGWLVGGLGGAVVATVARSVAPAWQGRTRRRRQRRAVARALPEAIELLVLVVRAGRVPAAAVADIADRVGPPLDEAFGAVVAGLAGGQRFADAIGELARRIGPAAQPMVDALATADRYGLPLAPMLEVLAAEARRQRRRADEADARQLPVRLSVPLVLCTLPSFVLIAIVPLLIGALSSLDLSR